MCIITGPPQAVRSVAKTNIFARSLEDGRQVLVYSMNITAMSAVAMILPLPVPPSPRDDAVAFINLHGYSDFFSDLDMAFPADLATPISASIGRSAPMPRRPTLKVHRVGKFDASFVPSQSDFDRLDPRFRLSDDVWAKLPHYADYGFAVFQLHTGGLLGRIFKKPIARTIHPMAFVFPRRDPQQLFFPTVHVHDGSWYESDEFDHKLFAQVAPDERLSLMGWQLNHTLLSGLVDAERAAGVIDVKRPCFRKRLQGSLPNQDTVVNISPG